MKDQELDQIANDTLRSPKERHLARILECSKKLLIEDNYEDAFDILEVHVEANK
jgi:hypothetical protein